MRILLFPLFGAFLVIRLAIVAACVWAFVDCLRRPERAFPMMGKQTKQTWLAITGVAAAFALAGFFALVALVAAIVYFVDVRPRVRQVPRG
jgi:Protein of unknown function (DUF2516)